MIALRYLVQQPTAILHAWAYGCHLCHFGIQQAPEIHSSQALYVQRAVQAGMGDITFCDCQAGVTYRRYLQGVWTRLQGPAFERLKERIRNETRDQPVLHRSNP